MKTAMQELIEIISHEQDHKKSGSEEWFALSHLKVEAENLLEKEKQQIVDARLDGIKTCELFYTDGDSMKSSEQYYTETYNK
jgi:hypothetical protein